MYFPIFLQKRELDERRKLAFTNRDLNQMGAAAPVIGCPFVKSNSDRRDVSLMKSQPRPADAIRARAKGEDIQKRKHSNTYFFFFNSAYIVIGTFFNIQKHTIIITYNMIRTSLKDTNFAFLYSIEIYN